LAFARRFFLLLILLGTRFAFGQEVQTSRLWIAGQEAGGSTERKTVDAQGTLLETREWSHLERMGTMIQQELKQQAVKRPDGSMHVAWSLNLSQEPLEGAADWSPSQPDKLKLTFKNGPPRVLDIPPGTLVWPGDLDDGLKAAARTLKPVRMKSFSFPTQEWTELELQPVGPEPLPGFPDTVRFRGRSAEGGLVEEVELWLSPSQGEVKHQGSMAGIPLLSQRIELPAPAGQVAGAGLFERTIKTLPPHPFLLWLPEVKVRWTGRTPENLGEDDQQRRLGPGLFLLSRALPPTPREALDPPVQGRPAAEDAPFLAATPLVQFNDPVFKGLERRLNPPAKATRWQLAQLVTAFVYDWIRDKNYTVGFASAQEVARNPQGACAQHGVLAVALLRRLGVPARGVTGWMAFGDVLGLHFWVEVKLGGRWIPVDPTFDEAPASAYRLKLGTSDLADLGSVGTGTASMNFLEGVWLPDGPWAADVRPQGDTLMAPGGLMLRVAGARWAFAGGRATLLWNQSHRIEAVPRPAPAQLVDAHRLQGASADGERRIGWWQPRTSTLWIDLGAGRWLQVEALTEPQAFALLAALEANERRLPRAA
jgi:transglutaminase-like putative cysteine protease